MSRSDRDVLEVEVVRAHEDADLEEVERVDVVVVSPIEAAQIDATQVPGEREEVRIAASVSHSLAEPVSKSDLKFRLARKEQCYVLGVGVGGHGDVLQVEVLVARPQAVRPTRFREFPENFRLF